MWIVAIDIDVRLGPSITQSLGNCCKPVRRDHLLDTPPGTIDGAPVRGHDCSHCHLHGGTGKQPLVGIAGAGVVLKQTCSATSWSSMLTTTGDDADVA